MLIKHDEILSVPHFKENHVHQISLSKLDNLLKQCSSWLFKAKYKEVQPMDLIVYRILRDT